MVGFTGRQGFRLQVSQVGFAMIGESLAIGMIFRVRNEKEGTSLKDDALNWF